MKKQNLINEAFKLYADNGLLVRRQYIEDQVNYLLDDEETALFIYSHSGFEDEELTDEFVEGYLEFIQQSIYINKGYINKYKKMRMSKGKDKKTVIDLERELQGNRIEHIDIYPYIIKILDNIKKDRNRRTREYDPHHEELTDDIYDLIFNKLDRLLKKEYSLED